MFKNAFRYITRKPLKSVVILLIIATMSTLSLVGLSIKLLPQKERQKMPKERESLAER